MPENAELWSYPDEKSVRITLTSWLRWHKIKYNENMSNEELRPLYVNAECSKI